jgi:hypothetical protein
MQRLHSLRPSGLVPMPRQTWRAHLAILGERRRAGKRRTQSSIAAACVACCAIIKFVYNIKIAGENANAVHSEEADVHSQSGKPLDLEPIDLEPANAGMGL